MLKKNNFSNEINLGDLVEFVTKEHQFGITKLRIRRNSKTRIYTNGQTKMTPPVMVVIEKIHENIGQALNNNKSTKLFCQWYSHRNNKFISKWLDSTLLKKKEYLEIKREFNLQDIVSLKTALNGNTHQESIVRHKIKEEFEEIDYKLSQIFDTTMYLPPQMVITSIEPNNNGLNQIDKKSNFIKRYLPKNRIKCMWFDSSTNKYSENHFAQEALIAIDNLNFANKGN